MVTPATAAQGSANDEHSPALMEPWLSLDLGEEGTAEHMGDGMVVVVQNGRDGLGPQRVALSPTVLRRLLTAQGGPSR